ncbi:MAG: tyrosine-protein kinase [Thermoleophilaceae bacterium]|jgi:capsular exopolysaccharide synthesis family protein|nr:tyrosine-protein kinase [Thermoleophilaceae bacterium]
MNSADPQAARDSLGTGWRRPQGESTGIERYFRVLRERAGLILLVVLTTTLMAGAYLAVATKQYKAEADLLVIPASRDDQSLNTLPLIRESSDPTRDVETAARITASRNVAKLVKRDLGLNMTDDELLKHVKAEPVAQSNVVAVSATADSPNLARDIANGFADGVVTSRSNVVRSEADKLIAGLRQQVQDAQDAGENTDALSANIAALQTVREKGDPTMHVETRADAPAAAFSPRPMLTIFAGLIGGLILGVGGAFAMSALDPRLRREEQLRDLYSLPILARVPKEKRAPTYTLGKRRFGIGPRERQRRALPPGELSAATLESFRTLRTMLAAQRREDGNSRSILVTGPSPSEGKTTTAINLASSLALAGNRVILIEADFRRPTVGEALGVRARVGIGDVLLGNVALEDALVLAPPFGDNLCALLVDRADDWLAEVLSLPAAQALLEDAKRLADYVVLDSPPLTQVIDAMPLARQVDDVVLVTRLGSSNLTQLAHLGDLLDQNGIRPAGFVVVGGAGPEESSYYREAQRRRAEQSDWLVSFEQKTSGAGESGEPTSSAQR